MVGRGGVGEPDFLHARLDFKADSSYHVQASTSSFSSKLCAFPLPPSPDLFASQLQPSFKTIKTNPSCYEVVVAHTDFPLTAHPQGQP